MKRKTLKKISKYIFFSLIAAVFIVLASVPISIYEKPSDLLSAENSQPLIIDNVNLVDVRTGEIQPNRQLKLANGVIEDIRVAGQPVDTGYKRIDANGSYVIPGMFDMHVHIHDRKYLGMYLAYGITSVRNMRGLPMHLRWKKELQQREWLGSNLYTSSPVLDGEKYAHALQQVVTSPEKARELVKTYKDKGYDFIKAYGYLEQDVFLAIVDEAAKLNFPVAKHGPNPVEGADLSTNKNLQSLEHVEDIFQGPLNFEFDRAKLLSWINDFKEIKPVVTPTLATFNHLTELSDHKSAFIETLNMETINPLYKYLLGEFSVKRWLNSTEEQALWNKKEQQFLLDIVKTLDEHGVKLLVGSDAGTMFMPPGESSYKEIYLMSLAGVDSLTVLQAATVNAAEALGISQDYGSIEVGKVADLVLITSNPLNDISTLRQPTAVIKAGQWLSKEDLLALKQSGKNPSNLYISLGRFLEDLLVRAFE